MKLGIIFINREEFNEVESTVFEFYKSKYKNIGNSERWSDGIDALDGSGQVLMIVDERVLDYPFTQDIIEVEGTNAKWFKND